MLPWNLIEATNKDLFCNIQIDQVKVGHFYKHITSMRACGYRKLNGVTNVLTSLFVQLVHWIEFSQNTISYRCTYYAHAQ